MNFTSEMQITEEEYRPDHQMEENQTISGEDEVGGIPKYKKKVVHKKFKERASRVGQKTSGSKSKNMSSLR